MMKVNIDIEKEIPLSVERNYEDSEVFIDRMYDAVHMQKNLENSSQVLSKDIKSYLENLVQQHTDTKTKRENYYEFELIKCYRERISFLEDELRQKNIIIADLLSLSKNYQQQNVQTQTRIKSTDNQITDKSLSTPEIFDFDTPNTSLQKELTPMTKSKNFTVEQLSTPRDENLTVDNDALLQYEKTKQLLNDQLTSIRLQKHERYTRPKGRSFNKKVDCSKEASTKTVSSTSSVEKKNSTLKKNVCIRQSVIVCGDSMVNGLDSNGVSSRVNQVSVRSFSGATSKDMIDYCKPLVNKKPNKLIFHVGTNDLTKNIVDSRENFETIIKYVRQVSPNTEIVLSNVCTRKDDPRLEPKRTELNNKISKITNDQQSKHRWQLPSQKEIAPKHPHWYSKVGKKHQKPFTTTTILT